jgi:disease resistance protein RPM1
MWTASSVSTWISPASLLLLSYLDIEVHKIEGNDIQILGMLPSLRHLWLGASGHLQELPVEERFMVSADAFPCARVCKFFNFVTVPSMFPRGAMPRVEHLEFCLRPSRFFTDGDFDLSDLGMGHLPSLDRVVINLHSERADSKEDVGEVEKGLRHAAGVHPNYPSIDVRHH